MFAIRRLLSRVWPDAVWALPLRALMDVQSTRERVQSLLASNSLRGFVASIRNAKPIPPITINAQNEIEDGIHRLTAHVLVRKTKIFARFV